MTVADYIHKFVSAYGKNLPGDLVKMNQALQAKYQGWLQLARQKKQKRRGKGKLVYLYPLDYRDKIILFVHRPIIRFFVWVVYLVTVAGAPFLDYFRKANYKRNPPSRDWTGFVIYSLLLCLVCYWLGVFYFIKSLL